MSVFGMSRNYPRTRPAVRLGPETQMLQTSATYACCILPPIGWIQREGMRFSSLIPVKKRSTRKLSPHPPESSLGDRCGGAMKVRSESKPRLE